MKLRSSTIIHKTDVGGIVLNIQNKAEAEEAFAAIRTRLEEAGRSAAFEGVVVQPMLTGGQEAIVGMSHDPVFGPLVMVGMGGVYVELNKDVAFALHPLTDKDPDVMLAQLKSLPLLTGWRGSAPKDLDALGEILLRFSAMIEDFPEISEMEINPLMVFDKGNGCAVVDARIFFAAQEFE
jgi:acyl-CoA synthetase (NDP forming)